MWQLKHLRILFLIKNDCRYIYTLLSLTFPPLNLSVALCDALSIKCNYTYVPSFGELANLWFSCCGWGGNWTKLLLLLRLWGEKYHGKHIHLGNFFILRATRGEYENPNILRKGKWSFPPHILRGLLKYFCPRSVKILRHPQGRNCEGTPTAYRKDRML